MAVNGDFHWLYLLILLICGFLSVSFLFYFNRLFASLVFYAIRTYVWRQYHVYIDIQALQLSLLGGRCFFKGFRYHGHNETILINDGYITWRYWLRRVRGAECLNVQSSSVRHGEEEEEGRNRSTQTTKARPGSTLPCRIKLKVRGIEWFIYNRTAAYEAIESGLLANGLPESPEANSACRPSDNTEAPCTMTGNGVPAGRSKQESLPSEADEQWVEKECVRKSSDFTESVVHENGQQMRAKPAPLPSFLTLLPMKIECSKGAIVMGNNTIRSVLTAKIDAAHGHVDAWQARSTDLYKQMFEFELVHPVVELRENHDFKVYQLPSTVKPTPGDGQNRSDVSQKRPRKEDGRVSAAASAGAGSSTRTWTQLFRYIPGSAGRRKDRVSAEGLQIPGQEHWLGLKRYLGDDENIAVEQERWRSIEYGRHPIIVDSPSVNMSIHWDVPGLVTGSTESEDIHVDEEYVNRGTPPDWAVELRINGGLISYGPWADRLRTDLQPMFFPSPYKDAVPADRLSPGQTRVSTIFKLYVDIEETTTLMIPTRESSKDWRWKDDRSTTGSANKDGKDHKGFNKRKRNGKVTTLPPGRPYGWLDVELQPDSTIAFSMDLVARRSRYMNQLNIDLRGPKMSSSVNHGLLLRAQTAAISCDLSNPLRWNEIRQWTVAVDSAGLELFLLRDHIFLLTDLIGDWTVGGPADFHTYVPFVYTMDLRLDNFNLCFNANDSNVISDPSSTEENTFMTIWGQTLKANVQIPLISFRPHHSQIHFDIDAQNGGFKLSTPPWNTQHVFLESSEIATMEELKLDGSYTYFTSTSPALTDVLQMNVHGISPKIWLYGFVIRAFMRIKDNYFGDDIHFRTLEEYQEQVTQGDNSTSRGGSNTRRTRISNDLDVILSITAVTANILLPSCLYSAATNITLDVPSLGLDLRSTNYYMDMELAFSPIAVSLASLSVSLEQDSTRKSETQVFIDGVGIRGHRLFGLPPTEPTYVCNWDFDVGAITGECSTAFVNALSSALRCFPFTFNDAENAMPPLFPIVIHDITFLRARLESLHVWLRIDEAALLLSAQDLSLGYNDWAGGFFSEHSRIDLLSITVALVDISSLAAERNSRDIQLNTYAFFESSLTLAMHHRKDGFNMDHQLQQEHISSQDTRTTRTPWLLKDYKSPQLLDSHRSSDIMPPAMPFPPMPEPLRERSVLVSSTESESNDILAIRRPKLGSEKIGSFAVHASRTKAAKDLHTIEAQQSQDSIVSSNLPFPGKTMASCASVDATSNYSRLSPEKGYNSSKAVRTMRVSNNVAEYGGSNPYREPCFGLKHVSLDLSDVPTLLETQSSRASSECGSQRDINEVETEELSLHQERCQRISLLVDLRDGVRALCKPQSLQIMASLFGELQVQEPLLMVDRLQIDALGRLPERHIKSDNHGSITEVRMRIPCLKFRLMDRYEDSCYSALRVLRCELDIDGSVITARNREIASSEVGASTSATLSAHIMLDNTVLTTRISDQQNSKHQAAIRFGVHGLSLWGCRAAESTAHVQFKDLEGEVDIQQMKSVTQFVQCGETLAKSIRHLQALETRQTVRLRLLVRSLAVEGQEIPDPPFLTRASYVVRSASSHLRASESWRIVSRLRYVYHILSAQAQSRVRSQCTSDAPSCPENARDDVVAIFRRLGIWDGKDVKGSTLLNEAFGREVGKEAKTASSLALKASIKAGSVRMLLQPGTTQSQMIFRTIVVETVLHQRPQPLQGASTVEKLASSQVYCSNTALTFNLGLLEPLQDLLGLLESQGSATPSLQDTATEEPRTNIYRMHFILVSEANTLALEGISLRILYCCRPLSSSVIVDKTADASGPGTTFLNCADLITTEVSSHSRIVGVGKVDRPSIFGNLDGHKPNASTSSWHLAASCTDISLKILDDPLSLLEVADHIMSNEAPPIQRMLDSGQSKPRASQPGTVASANTPLGKPHVALFLDSYMISYTILPALSYRVTGRVGRLSVKPGARRLPKIVIDFDLKEHAHAFLGRIGSNIELISESVIPPINGRLVLGTDPLQKDISSQSTIEHISLDAAAVHALLATLGRPEIGELAANIHNESSRLYRRYKPTASSQKSAPVPAEIPQPILFDGYVTLVGLGIHTRTSKDSGRQGIPQLDFELGHVHLKGNNRGVGDRTTLKLPELSVSFRGLQMGVVILIAGQSRPYGDLMVNATFQATSKPNERNGVVRVYQLRSTQCEMTLYTGTASVILGVLDDLRESFKDIDMTNEVKGLQKLRRATLADLQRDLPSKRAKGGDTQSTALFDAMYSVEMTGMQMIWKVGDSVPLSPGREAEDLVLSFTKIDLATRRDNAARLLIQNLQLQMVTPLQKPTDRSLNSALLPEVVFNVAYMSTVTDWKLAFQAAGKSLDLSLTSQFIIPANHLRRSIALAVNRVRTATKTRGLAPAQAGTQPQNWLKHKRLTSLLIDADFAGAVVYIHGRRVSDSQSSALDVLHGRRPPQQGRYGQFTHDNAGSDTTLRAPGVAFKVQYKDNVVEDSSLNAEVKVDASSNVLYPSVVPLVLEISSSVKEVVGEPDPQAAEQTPQHRPSTTKWIGEDRFRTADPSSIFQRCILNLGLRIRKQDFSLSCQPIARVAATAQVDNIYLTVNTVQSIDHGRSFALSSSFSGLQASVQHVYSRESSGGFEVQAAMVSLMNSKHLGAPNGISVISKTSPLRLYVNVKQLQDFLLFREIWLPADIGKAAPASTPSPSSESQAYIVQKYQQIASAGAFPWNATLSITELDFQIDLGQSLGKMGFTISDLWVSSSKSSDWEQNLCLGVKNIKLDATGRMSGYVDVQGVVVRTTIRWPTAGTLKTEAPLIQASAGFGAVRIKAAFEYQAFLVADLVNFEFLMYNVRNHLTGNSDRLVGVVELSALRGFCTTTSASQGLALYQTFERLIQEKQTAYQASLKQLEKFLRRRSTINPQALRVASPQAKRNEKHLARTPLRLQTNVRVSMSAVNVGVFPGTFFDTQLFKVQALGASAQSAVSVEKGRLHSTLQLALGQLQVALSGVTKMEGRKWGSDVPLEDIMASAINSRGGTILKVPKVVATMQTWQWPGSTDIDYIFKSAFQGKVDVGWNYSRIGFLRGMWNNHVRALASRLGKPLPQSALQITAALDEDGRGGGSEPTLKREKITAVVNVPQSKYQYVPLEPPVIETPQLRDMGEATPPLEWIGLHRERLPNLTHQILIVSLLELAREVDEAYSRILGSS
ncbi:MAG: hypothetical protein Q9201_005123 [Fulgogasparrea decipioides]